MTTFLRNGAFAAALAFAAAGPAGAAQYRQVDTAASKVGFAYSQMSVGMEGGFGKLEVPEFHFDPAAPDTARVVARIPLSSIDAGYQEANAELAKPEWLDTGAHPAASFTSSKVEALGGNRYQVSGTLSIKGKSQDVSAPFTFKEEGGNAVFDGAFEFKRADFGVGEGAWGDFGIVANEIRIKFHVVAKP
ncbi:YceI family protein [Parapusillimonas granuli]|uniref:YceI family protein n=1 Tax=Parapusillimonas granuli TaxID=380911 RepID=A0A853G1K4_9BURK|nr:YceI family protein [Parapusillimonas granuli]MBB5215768.1 polyisoprenoid-binding protein YceI [Parapusillimonas granuli]MEB2399541.1 YceI family protein [Alcaligenaceae bacterium]NYT51168.1 YceI family protein [Parapusillimonas granuli]